MEIDLRPLQRGTPSCVSQEHPACLTGAGPPHYILPTGYRSDRQKAGPDLITVQSGALRHPKDASAASALDGHLGGSRLECHQDNCFQL